MIKFYKSSKQTAILEPFPSYGIQASDGSCRIEVAGWAYFPYIPTARKKLVLRLLTRVMQATPEDTNSELFRSRVEKFVSDGSPGLEIFCRCGDHVSKLRRKNKRNGHYRGRVRLSEGIVASSSTYEDKRRFVVPFQIETDDPDIKPVSSFAYVLAAQGISVISDIDDTIKISDVGDRKQLLANTFLRKFRGIDGMADLYEEWFKAGADFHYVSSSPWQLHEPLLELQTEEGFPGGTMHLRNFQLRKHMMERALMIRRHGKSTSIKTLFKTFSERKFILVGDSGEKDPEIYRKICRKYSGQVAGLFIRSMSNKPLEDERLIQCKSSLPASVPCAKFHSPEELKQLAAPIFEQHQELVGV